MSIRHLGETCECMKTRINIRNFRKKNLQNFSDFACNLAKNVISLAVANFWLVHLIDGLFYWLNVSLR